MVGEWVVTMVDEWVVTMVSEWVVTVIASAIGPHVPNLGAVVTLFGAIGYCCFWWCFITKVWSSHHKLWSQCSSSAIGTPMWQIWVQWSQFLGFYRTQVSLGSGLWVPVYIHPRALWNIADVTLADDDTNSMLADDANRAIWGWLLSFRSVSYTHLTLPTIYSV